MNNQHAQALVETLLWGMGLMIPLCLTGGWMFQRVAFSFTGQWMHQFCVRDVIYQQCNPTPDTHPLHEARASFYLKKLPGFQSIQFASTSSPTGCRVTTTLRYHFGMSTSSWRPHLLRWQHTHHFPRNTP